VILATKDQAPIIVFDFTEVYDSSIDNIGIPFEIRNYLENSNIAVFKVSKADTPDIQDIPLITQIALDTLQKATLLTTKKNKPPKETKTKSKNWFWFKVFAISAIGIYLYSYASDNKKNKTPNSININTTSDIPEKDINTQSKKPDLNRERLYRNDAKCDTKPPQNGNMKLFPSVTKLPLEAYWKFENITEYHVYIWTFIDDKKVAEIYLAPQESFSIKSPAYQFRYKVYLTKEWCNAFKMNNPIGYEPSLISIGIIPSSFNRDTLATTTIQFDRSNLNTSTQVIEVMPQ
jgi:hypothetical protein